uniref:PID domain-containing protein n=1 Tax=Lepeophtheirus salmonis TaxID=72036 RepID=A0A0K2U7N0_LEPSM
MIKKSYTTVFLSDNLSRLRIHKEEGKKENASQRMPHEEEGDSSSDGGHDPLRVSLPKTFTVKYLGRRPALGLWGIKHTREPVDELVRVVRGQRSGAPLALLNMTISNQGVQLIPHNKNQNPTYDSGHFEIDTISYGVQDLVYTRVFAMIVVKDTYEEVQHNHHPDSSLHIQSRGFQCYGFVCDSRNEARKLTYALATAFSKFSAKKNEAGGPPKTRFAIDLRRNDESSEGRRDQKEESGRKFDDIFDSSEA